MITLPGYTDFAPLYRGRRHEIYRARSGVRPVVIKTAAAGTAAVGAVAVLRHEYELLRGLAHPGVVEVIALEWTPAGPALVMEDVGAQNLRAAIGSGPLATSDFLDLALKLTEALRFLHEEARLIHRDLNPNNIVWDPVSGRLTLIDFGLATPLSAHGSFKDVDAQLAGTLPYLSPEQTGRTGRSVDERTDYYALGVTFYEMLTGAPPFFSSDAMEIIHAHLAQRPVPPHERAPQVPQGLSGLVLKLLAKAPEDRYQTAAALADDLRVARDALARHGAIEPFPLAQKDVPRELHVPDRLYGREAELEALHQAFERACAGARELCLVSGAPGVGKSALVDELYTPVTERRGMFLRGKFDQLQRAEPYSGLTQAFRGAMRRVLAEPEASLQRWKKLLLAALGQSARVIVDVIPEVAHVIGPQPEAPELSPTDARSRLVRTFLSFVRVFARADHPLVLFLDDLQWVDPASLYLLQQLLDDAECRHLLVVGAFRDAEVGPEHPLQRMLDEARRAGATAPTRLCPGALDLDAVTRLCADTLRCEPERCAPLAGLLSKKTAGNPFFLRRLLRELRATGLISWGDDGWRWSLSQIERVGVTDNVVALMTLCLDRLPPPAREIVEVAACIGNRADIGILAAASGRSRPRAADDLWPALADGLLHPLHDAYLMPRSEGPQDHQLDGLVVTYRFAHDRVQHAAYARLSDERRSELHLTIGRLLRAEVSADPDRLFDALDQLNRAQALITDEGERLELASLNLRAGRKARASAAYETALSYLSAGMSDLPAGDRAWEGDGALCFALHRDRAECAYLTGQHALAGELIEAALAHVPSLAALADLYNIRVVAAMVAGDHAGALRCGREGLKPLGVVLPEGDIGAALAEEMAAVTRNLGDRRIDDLIDRPAKRGVEELAAMGLLASLVPPAYVIDQDLLAFIMARMVNLSLKHGWAPESANACAMYGAILGDRTGEYEAGHAFGRLGVAVSRRCDDGPLRCKVLHLFGAHVNHWRAPLRTSEPIFREAMRAGVESGELQYAVYANVGLIWLLMPLGVPLDDLLSEVEAALTFAGKLKNKIIVQFEVAYRQAARHLMGRTRAPGSFDDDDFAEAAYLADAAPTVLCLYQILRLQAAYLIGDIDGALRLSREAAPRLPFTMGMVANGDYRFYSALALAARLEVAPPEERAALREELDAHQRQLQVWAGHCAANFQHKHALVAAEVARVTGSPWEAAQRYNEAIECAKAQSFIHDVALASELGHGFFLSHGQRDIAEMHLAAAFDGYKRWGADLKVAALLRRWPHLAEASALDALTAASVSTSSNPALALDAISVIKAAQAIAGELELDHLLQKLVRIILEAAGAERGVLVLDEGGAPVARARGAMGEEVVLLNVPATQCAELPRAVFDYVWRTGETLAMTDAADAGTLAADADVRRRKSRSVLCVPVRRQGRLAGLLYLENDLTPYAFTRARVETVQHLAAQAAISLENTLLVEGLRREVAERERAEAALQASNAEMERRVRDRTADLEAVNASLEGKHAELRAAHEGLKRTQSQLVQAEKMASLGQMVAGVAHEINNPLSFVTNNLSVLQRDVRAVGGLLALYREGDAALSRSQPELHQRITEECERIDVGYTLGNLGDLCSRSRGGLLRIQQIVKDLRDFARLDRGDLHKVDVNEGIESTLNIIRALAQRREVEVTTDLCSMPPFACYPAKLNQVVMNLVVNAIDASSAGARVTVQTKLEGGNLRIEVGDSGHGIDPSIRDQIFDPFFTTKPPGAGTGLGLSISYAIVQEHGGAIEVDSAPGRGSRFIVHLPGRA